MENPACAKCGRRLINRRFDHCAYCGTSVPPDLRLSDESKQELEAAEKLRFEDENKEAPKFVREFRAKNYGGNSGDSGAGGGCDGGG